MFDLNGFIVCRGLLSPEEVAELNGAIDRHADEIGWFQRTVPPPTPTPAAADPTVTPYAAPAS